MPVHINPIFRAIEDINIVAGLQADQHSSGFNIIKAQENAGVIQRTVPWATYRANTFQYTPTPRTSKTV